MPRKKPKIVEIQVSDQIDADELFLSPNGLDAEGEDDLETIRPEGLREAVVSATDWTTETIIRLFDRGTIELDPAFQRRDAWTPNRKSNFIESLVMGLPIPQIVLAERKDKRGQFVVLDGKQRLLTLQQFAGDLSGTEGTRLKLTGLKNLTDLNGLTYEEVSNSPRLADDLEAFRNQPIRAVVVKNWPDENFLYLVFLRLNTGSVPLAPQELRQALHPGPFVTFSNQRSANSAGLRSCLRIHKPDFRMRDVELLIRFYSFRMFMGNYAGNMKGFLDNTCKVLNERWGECEGEIRSLADDLDEALALSERVFPTGKYMTIYRNEGFESRFNRAVYDLFAYYFSIAAVRKEARLKGDKIREMFAKLCANDSVFLDALQTTTKSLSAVEKRFNTFGSQLAKVLKMELPVPHLSNGRLTL